MNAQAWPQAAIGAALALLAAAVWLPPVPLDQPTVEVLVTFDITQSMDVPDGPGPDGDPAPSRLAAARAAVRDTLAALPCGSKVGWAVFADYRVMPLVVPVEVCSHYEDLLASLAQIDGRMRWANASNVGKGLTWAVRSARAIGPDTRVLFFTDGQEAPPLREGERPPMQDIVPGAVKGWVFGVGGDQPARIPKTDRDGRQAGYWSAGEVVQAAGPGGAAGHEHLSELREPYLRDLARLMGLGYQRLQSAGQLASALRDPALAQPRPVPTDLRWVPALLALMLLAWRFLPDRRHGRPKPLNPVSRPPARSPASSAPAPSR